MVVQDRADHEGDAVKRIGVAERIRRRAGGEIYRYSVLALFGEVIDKHVARIGGADIERIVPLVTSKKLKADAVGVGPIGTRTDDIVAGSSEQAVIPAAAVNAVIARSGENEVAAATAKQSVDVCIVELAKRAAAESR